MIAKLAAPISKELLLTAIGGLSNTEKAKRDKAILLLGWVGALRVSEIVNIKAEDLERNQEGFILKLYTSKNIKAGDSQQKFFPYSSDINLSPVRAIEALIASSDDSHSVNGDLFL